MRGRLPYAIALVLSGCTIQREVPLDRFACASGGPCNDAGMPPIEEDAGVADAMPGKDVDPGEDAGPTDDGGAPQPDAGPPLAACLKIQPLQDDGLVGGNSSNEVNTYEPPCSAPGGKDVVYGFRVPGRLRELTISTGGSMFDTALHLYRGDCAPTSMVTCNDEADSPQMGLLRTSFMRLENVEPGDYAIIVDGFGSAEAGMYQLSVSGKIAPSEPCDPAQLYFTCEIGTCSDDGKGAFRCPAVLDCPDGIDADEDGMVDEDTCTDPPIVSCAQVNDAILGDFVDLSATVFDQGGIIYREWRVVERPFGSFDVPLSPNQEASVFYPDIVGPYRVRYRASDDLFQLSACEVSFTPEVIDWLHVELIWNADRLFHEHHSILGLHLLHPSASRWFDARLDCYPPDCLFTQRDWGQQNEPRDDPYMIGLALGPQWVSVFEPQLNGTYGVGVEYIFDNFQPSATAWVNIYCYGFLEESFGPVELVNGDSGPQTNDFWKVAEIDMNSGGCNVIPYLNGSEPRIVSGAEAQSSR